MKKLLAVLMVLVLCMGFAACGGSGDQNDGPSGDIEFNFEIVELTEDAAEKAVITAVDTGNGETLWTYETEPCYVSELDVIQEVGPCVNGYMFIAGGTVYCLNPITGEVDWANDEFGGASASWAFNDDACFFVCGYYGPDLMVIGPDGSTLHHYPSFAEYDWFTEGCFHPSAIKVKEGNAYITYDNNGKTLAVAYETGDVLDALEWSTPISEDQLVGMWTNDERTQDIVVDVEEDLTYTIYYRGYKYCGYIELFQYNDAIYDQPDAFRFVMTETEDPTFSGWESLGDYIIQVAGENGDQRWLNLAQLNNGDSIFSIYFDDFAPILHKIDAVG